MAVWSTPPHNSWATTVMGTIAKHVELPPPVPGAVGLFRCANIEQLTEELKQAGFRDVSAQELTWEPAFGTPETYWTSMTEVAAPVVAGLARADSQTRERIRNAVLEAAAAQLREGEVRLSAGAWTIVARK